LPTAPGLCNILEHFFQPSVPSDFANPGLLDLVYDDYSYRYRSYRQHCGSGSGNSRCFSSACHCCFTTDDGGLATAR
jgi:hypothetical protein